ncbi:carbohydrate ABC transporter permease [Hydrogenispora ethanolica]|uniref:carbohydrate ABC transporter permease n=1 Tax=Hydrogenispora ethanolica TaxID=1082276 RepID=UPI0010460E50
MGEIFVAGLKKLVYSQKLAPYVFVSAFFLTFAIFFVYPLANTTVMSFQSVLPGEVEFIGLDNYTKLFHDEVFWKAVANSFLYMVLTVALLIPFPMVFACFIHSKIMIGGEFFKSVLFIPVLTSLVVAGTIFRLIFGELPGSFMNQLLGYFHHEPIKWLKMQTTGFGALIVLACWRWTGVNILYFLSGLKSIPQEFYESAEIDGANAWQKFFRITMPLLKPITIYVSTISVYAGLAMFLESYMLWTNNNSPDNIGLTIVGYLYRQGIEKNRMGYASAVGLVLLALAMLINLAQLRLTGVLKKEGE